MTSAPNAHLRFVPEDADQRWLMELEDVPDHPLHDAIIALLVLVLQYRYRHQDAFVARNLGCRWNPDNARVGVDPDVVLIEPAPPKDISTLRVWLPDHAPPRLAIEVVSETNATKDYVEGPQRMARLGAEELWIFDPKLHGPALDDLGGPFLLQIWRRAVAGNAMERIYAGDAPAHSPALDAWLIAVDMEKGKHLRLADDADGMQLWPTQAEAAEARADAAEYRARQEAEAREALEAEVQRLRALIDKNA